MTYRHPEGLLNPDAVHAGGARDGCFAQTARLREAGADIWPAYFAGHSLGEYNALSAFADVIPLETVLELVFHRGSTMHHLIERDAQGRSNYRMVFCARNQFGVDDAHVKGIRGNPWAKASGEFLGDRELQPRRPAVRHRRYDRRTQGPEGRFRPPRGRIWWQARVHAGARHRCAVPLHTCCARGVPEFRDKLDALLPAYIDYRGRLVDRYILNLVATPFRDDHKEIRRQDPRKSCRPSVSRPRSTTRPCGIPTPMTTRSSAVCS